MARKGVFRRCSLIFEKLHYGLEKPSKRELLEYLYNYGFNISSRTLDRDIEDMRNEFGVEIEYDSYAKGYSINKDQSRNLNKFSKFLRLVNTAEILQSEIISNKDSLDFIDIEAEGLLKGEIFLPQLIDAVKHRKVIEMEYRSHFEDESKQYVIHPLLIKEYQKRWYVVASKQPVDELRSFGIDRIINLKVLTKAKAFKVPQDIKKKFDDVVGVNYSAGEPEVVQLKLYDLQARYLQSLPLHKSQKIEKTETGEYILTMFATVNFELKQKILMQADFAQVLEPKWLVDEMKQLLNDMLNQYPQ